jgi:hypothetical protein
LIIQKIRHVRWNFHRLWRGSFDRLLGWLLNWLFYNGLFDSGLFDSWLFRRLGGLLFAGRYFTARGLGDGLELIAHFRREIIHFRELAGLLGAGAQLVG